MDDDGLKEDCATQTIIESNFDSTTAELIEWCEHQIKKLEVENDDIKLYIDKLNFLFQLHNKESKRCEKTKLDEDTKI